MTALSLDAVAAVLLIPASAAALLASLPNYRISAGLNVGASLLTLLAAVSLFVTDRPLPGQYLLVDDLNIVFIVLNAFVGFTTSVFSASYIAHELETGRLTVPNLRFYHAMYQIMMFGMNLAFVSNNIGLMWVAVELATLTTVLMVGIYRTHEALEAAWKYFILGSVGIALALFGTILVYMAAQPVVGEGTNAMVWTVLIIVFAFGMGGPLANFAGLLHMVMHSLTKSAIFFTVGHIAQVKGTQNIAEIRGLTETHPGLGWALVIGVVAIAGLPPLGIFMSEFLVVSSTFARHPLLAMPLVFGILLAFGALLLRLTGVAFGEPRGSTAPAEASYIPMYSHLALVFAAGIYLPPSLVTWFQHVASILG
ncbi:MULTISPECIES: proton-conducting transporter membrane subunit [unclassified Mesorhizobium]|uniref:proton-conducting transporter transmembrane domain-containing protein n=1 Tax=unclassified Mesorhizobium TaxID=325217 RepID=UPI001093E653|nr:MULTISPECIES: proton-conducting transporter membrane subunit [unclassified Mesorhizobium]TGS47495.1 hydrogenase 4 subunit F [Mesorhizobium sp. M8A.F.Ca.ET.182.01.1.1]TGS84215.1 hydrogenase 4 subunit F [Mesorhizobium sp. M8A.F.Ca.ET.181.01.1.1]